MGGGGGVKEINSLIHRPYRYVRSPRFCSFNLVRQSSEKKDVSRLLSSCWSVN